MPDDLTLLNELWQSLRTGEPAAIPIARRIIQSPPPGVRPTTGLRGTFTGRPIRPIEAGTGEQRVQDLITAFNIMSTVLGGGSGMAATPKLPKFTVPKKRGPIEQAAFEKAAANPNLTDKYIQEAFRATPEEIATIRARTSPTTQPSSTTFSNTLQVIREQLDSGVLPEALRSRVAKGDFPGISEQEFNSALKYLIGGRQ